MNTEKLICADCKSRIDLPIGKRGNASIEIILWMLGIFPGLIYSLWRLRKVKRVCKTCGSDFLLPLDSSDTRNMLESMKQMKNNKNDYL